MLIKLVKSLFLIVLYGLWLLTGLALLGIIPFVFSFSKLFGATIIVALLFVTGSVTYEQNTITINNDTEDKVKGS